MKPAWYFNFSSRVNSQLLCTVQQSLQKCVLLTLETPFGKFSKKSTCKAIFQKTLFDHRPELKYYNGNRNVCALYSITPFRIYSTDQVCVKPYSIERKKNYLRICYLSTKIQQSLVEDKWRFRRHLNGLDPLGQSPFAEPNSTTARTNCSLGPFSPLALPIFVVFVQLVNELCLPTKTTTTILMM